MTKEPWDYKKSVATREAWRSQCVAGAVEAINRFAKEKNYAALWDLRARLTELLEAKDKYLWAAIGPDKKILATGSFQKVRAAAKKAGKTGTVIWFVASTQPYYDSDFGFEIVEGSGPGLSFRVRQRCEKCKKEVPLYSGICPHCSYVIRATAIPES